MQRQAAGFLAAHGDEFTRYSVEGGKLRATGSARAGLDIQYAWPHPTRALAYLAISNGGPGERGSDHALAVCHLGADGPAFGTEPVRLAARPLHLSLDRDARHLLVAYNNPSGITVHRLETDGRIGGEVAQPDGIAWGTFGHQVLVTPAGGAVLFPCRGHDARDGNPEQPGVLQVFGYEDGMLAPRARIAPDGGYGFGPRHLDFHPELPWMFLGLERQNEILVFRTADDTVDPEPVFRISTVTGAGEGRQAIAALHVHPDGRRLSVSNRCYGTVASPAGPVMAAGENSIATFAIDPDTGHLEALARAPTGGYLPRTFSIDPDGTVLIAANSEAARARTPGGDAIDVAPGLVMFRIGPDGGLLELDRTTVGIRGKRLFWAGFL